MLSGECVHCDESWMWGWDEKEIGHYCVLCGKCKNVFWIEFSRFGKSRDHETFLKEIAGPDEGIDWANNCKKNRIEDNISIQEEILK